MRTLRALLTAALSALTLLLPAAPATALPQEQAPPPACADVEGFHKLDFWIGDWEVVSPDGTPQGTNRIEKVLSGCALLEHWRGAGGDEGKSVFFYNHLSDTWKQVWITARATAVGGLKEKQLVEELEDGSVRFQGVLILPSGQSVLDRTTLTPLESGEVRQVIEYSDNGGVEWHPLFTGIYRPRET